jgi:uncharacterized NAD(P)/FAD-binding protein YdhS
MDANVSAARPLSVAIVGGGFAGTVVFAHLLELLPAGSAVTMFDECNAFGAGTAYRTSDKLHLLNVSADRMGAFEPDHFIRWLAGPKGRTAVAQICPARTISPSDYLPRALYGAYLTSVLDDALSVAVRRGVTAKLRDYAVTDIRKRGRWLEISAGSRKETFDRVVIATGNQPPRAPAFAKRSLLRSKDYIGDVWENELPVELPQKNATILVLGTGLTAIDTILSLNARGYEGHILAVSRHGWLPASHAAQRPAPWEWNVRPSQVAPSAVATLHWLKSEARLAQAAGRDWRSVFEVLRPVTTALWRELDEAEQQKVFRYHALWSVHRHRMAPEVADQIAALQHAGRLEIAAATILSGRRVFGSLKVRLRRYRSRTEETLHPALILNCTGPNYDVTELQSPLFRNLLRRGMVLPAPNGAGIAIEPDGSARSLAEGRIFALGTLSVGDQFECTAVPELRSAARRVAHAIAEEGLSQTGHHMTEAAVPSIRV